MTLCVTVGAGLVAGAPLERRIATVAFLTPLFHPVEFFFLFKLRAVALDVVRRTTFVALVAALRMSLRRSTPKNGRRRRYHAQVVYVDVDCGLFSFCLLYTSPSPRDQRGSRMPSYA